MINPDVMIGGFGTSKYQIDQLADAISTHLGHDVQGITLVDTLKRPDDVAETTHKKNIITHSAGFLALKAILDNESSLQLQSVTAVAPPMMADRRMLIARSRTIVKNLAVESMLQPLALKSNLLHARYMLDELRKNGIQHYSVIPHIATFDAYQAAMEINSPVRLALMTKEELFQYPDPSPYNLSAHSTEIVKLPGTHPDFVRKPIQAISALGYIASKERYASEYGEVSPINSIVTV